MNDYQKREAEKSAAARKDLELIAKALGWELMPDDPEQDFPARYFYMSNGQGLQICAGIMWNDQNRFEFTASKWPTHTDKEGKECRIISHDLGQEWQGEKLVEREPTPTTRAARNRTPEAIAKQIQSKLIPEYCRVWDLLLEVANSRQGYADKEANIISRLFEATQEERREGGKPCFIRNMPGDTMTIEYRSPGSIKIDLMIDDMVAVIEFLREKRTAENEI